MSVLAAIEVARRWRPSNPAYLYLVLLASLVVAWLIPPSALLELATVPRFAVAVVVWFTPIFIANLVFAERFRNVESSNVAFGANLLGAMVGGVMEYIALLTGYQMLLFLVALLYGAAFLAGRRYLQNGSECASAGDGMTLNCCVHPAKRLWTAPLSSGACPVRKYYSVNPVPCAPSGRDRPSQRRWTRPSAERAGEFGWAAIAASR